MPDEYRYDFRRCRSCGKWASVRRFFDNKGCPRCKANVVVNPIHAPWYIRLGVVLRIVR